MKKILSLLLLLGSFAHVHGQGSLIYGLELDQIPSAKFERFVSFDYKTGVKTVLLDSLDCCNGSIANTTMDPYNGRYFIVGRLNSDKGKNIYSIDVQTGALQHHGSIPYFVDPEYDPYTNAIIYRTRDALRRFNLATSKDELIGQLPSTKNMISGKTCVLNPTNQTYSFMDYKDMAMTLYNYDLQSKILTDSITFPTGRAINFLQYDINTQMYFGVVNHGFVIRFNPHSLKLDTIASLSHYNSHLNWQNCMMDPIEGKFLYTHYNTGSESRLAIVDIHNHVVDTTVDYLHKINTEQFYGMPQPVASLIGPTLTSPYGESYQWYLNDELIDGATSQTYTPIEVGSYMVDVQFPLYHATSKPIVLSELPKKIEPVQKQIQIYPNPNVGDFYVSSDQPIKPSHIKVRNYLGQQIQTVIQQVGETTLYLTNMPPSTYFISYLGDGEIQTIKLVVSYE